MKSFIFILLYFVCRATIAKGQMEGGTKAADGQFPFVVQIWSDAINVRTPMCVGAILTKNWVITAAHCIADDHGVPLNHLVVVAGTQHQGQRHRFHTRLMPDRSNNHVPDRLIPMTPFNIATSDIGLIYFLTHPLPVSNRRGSPVKAINIQNQADQPGTRCQIVGWGCQKFEDRSRVDNNNNIVDQFHQDNQPCCLKYDNATIDDPVECESDGFDGQFHLCVGRGDHDGMTLSGDSGSPLVQKFGGRDVIVGVASRTIWNHYIQGDENNRDAEDRPWVLEHEARPLRMQYTRLSHRPFQHWIRNEMDPNNQRNQGYQGDWRHQAIQYIQGNWRNQGNQGNQGNQRNLRNRRHQRNQRNQGNHGNADVKVTLVWMGLLAMVIAYI